MAKASFSAYVLSNVLLKSGEKVHFSTKKSTTNFGRPFCSFPFPLFASKWLKYAVFAFQKPETVGRKRGLRQLYTPPPLPISGQRAFSVEGGGGVYFEAHAAGILYPPPLFYTPPNPRSVFSGVGGGGV